MAGPLPDEVNLERLAKLLGVDELQVSRASMGSISVRARLGVAWMAASVEMNTISAAANPSVAIGQVLTDLAESLKKSMQGTYLEYASGDSLDAIAMNVGVKRGPEPEPRRPMTRFEAIAEELKKL